MSKLPTHFYVVKIYFLSNWQVLGSPSHISYIIFLYHIIITNISFLSDTSFNIIEVTYSFFYKGRTGPMGIWAVLGGSVHFLVTGQIKSKKATTNQFKSKKLDFKKLIGLTKTLSPHSTRIVHYTCNTYLQHVLHLVWWLHTWYRHCVPWWRLRHRWWPGRWSGHGMAALDHSTDTPPSGMGRSAVRRKKTQ